MTTKPLTDIGRAVLTRCDKGEYPDDIAEAEGVTLGYVYQILREHRPKRARKPREKTSTARAAILFYAMVDDMEPVEIVEEMKGTCSKTLVYRELKAAGLLLTRRIDAESAAIKKRERAESAAIKKRERAESAAYLTARDVEIKKTFDEGNTLEHIGLRFGLSRQRIHQILQR